MDKLQKLYDATSKHSHYQALPKLVKDLVGDVAPPIKRYENARMEYIKSNIDLDGKAILDVGANTGFFTISSLESGATSADVYEGDKSHTDFISNVSDILDLDITTHNQYLQFNEPLTKKYDVTYLLNVVHHLGDDFGNTNIDRENAKLKMLEILKYFSDKSDILVFQMGYCWKGNRDLLLFENGTKREILSFVQSNLSEHWDVVNIGMLESSLKYNNLNDLNIENDITLGEFGNRPLFILKSKNYSK